MPEIFNHSNRILARSQIAIRFPGKMAENMFCKLIVA
jgi:hypothetical protein